jgi:hypothetical protein
MWNQNNVFFVWPLVHPQVGEAVLFFEKFIVATFICLPAPALQLTGEVLISARNLKGRFD